MSALLPLWIFHNIHSSLWTWQAGRWLPFSALPSCYFLFSVLNFLCCPSQSIPYSSFLSPSCTGKAEMFLCSPSLNPSFLYHKHPFLFLHCFTPWWCLMLPLQPIDLLSNFHTESKSLNISFPLVILDYGLLENSFLPVFFWTRKPLTSITGAWRPCNFSPSHIVFNILCRRCILCQPEIKLLPYII